MRMMSRITCGVLLAALLSAASTAAFAAVSLVSSVLPSSRSVQVGATASAFATIINAGDETGTGCSITPIEAFSGTFFFQRTDPNTNAPLGNQNEPVNIPGNNGVQTFVIGFTPDQPFDTAVVQLSFDCTNSAPAVVTTGVNTLSLAASATPVPDVVALGATVTNDGIVHIPFRTAIGFFTVATVNVGAAGQIDASVNTGGANLPASWGLCETDPATSVCINPTTPTSAVVVTQIDAGATPTFAIFVSSNEDIDLDAAARRLFVNFADPGGVARGSTSVALRTRQFSEDLQPIFSANCTQGCHQPGGIAPFSLEAGVSFDGLVASGRVVPGDADASLLIRRLEGTIAPQMPKDAPPLAAQQIQWFRDWIAAGAPNDGASTGPPPPGPPPPIY